jgi:hypothetical protein
MAWTAVRLTTLVYTVLAWLAFGPAALAQSLPVPPEPPEAADEGVTDAPQSTVVRYDLRPYHCAAVELIKGDTIDLDNPEASIMALLDMKGHWIVLHWDQVAWAQANADSLLAQCVAGELLKQRDALAVTNYGSDLNCGRSAPWAVHDDPIMRWCSRGLKP